jgi:hypothetical protein
MFELNYYFVDVGDNFCEVRERTTDIALKDAFSDKGTNKTAFARKYIRLKLKEMLISDCDVYKFVAVNKAGKLTIESRVENKYTDEVVEPFYSTDTFDLFMVHPEEQLYVICSVIPRNYEHVLVDYDQLYDPFSKSKNKSKRKTL